MYGEMVIKDENGNDKDRKIQLCVAGMSSQWRHSEKKERKKLKVNIKNNLSNYIYTQLQSAKELEMLSEGNEKQLMRRKGPILGYSAPPETLIMRPGL